MFVCQHRSPLDPRMDKRVSFALESVHSHHWRSCPVEPNAGFKYFVTFVDDFLKGNTFML